MNSMLFAQCNLILILTWGLLPNAFATAPPPRPSEFLEKAPLMLAQGEQRLFRIPGLLRYSLGSDAIRGKSLTKSIGTSLSKTELREALLIKGIHEGHSDLWVWKTDGTAEHRAIRVEKAASEELKPTLLRALSQLDESEVLLSGSGVILRGEISTLAESARIQALAEGFPSAVKDETQLIPSLLEQGRQKLEKWIAASHPNSALRLEIQNGTLFLLGNIEKAYTQSSIRKQAKALFPAVQITLESLPDDSPTIYFQVFLLELKKDRFHSLGISWPSSVEGAFRATTTGIQDLLQLDLALQELEGEGSVRVLSNPELAVRAPGDAELFSGGELPIQVESRFYSNVTWKNFGLTLKLKVTHVAGSRIRLEIFTEVSHLDPSISSTKVPGLQANRMKTQVDATFGVPLLLSGLLQQGTRQQARGLPILREIPVLGALFGSEDYLHEKSELVAILLPSNHPPAAPMNRVQTRAAPKGPVPPPREWISPSQERALRSSPDFPWNAFDSAEFTPARRSN